MHKHVEVLIGRLATDSRLQSRFARRPNEVLREQGLELTEIEIEALAATDPEAFRTLTAALDARLRRASNGESNEVVAPELTNQEHTNLEPNTKEIER
jgi:hypothetical protein